MAKEPQVTINHDLTTGEALDAPAEAQKLVGDRFGTFITDAMGRKLKVRKLSALHRFDMAAVVGDQSNNIGVMGPASLAFSVIEIDGQPVFQPQNYVQLRALIGRLDDEGLEAVVKVYVDSGWGADQPVNADAVKN